MRTTTHIAKSAATPKTGRLAKLLGLSHSQGSATPSRALLALPALLLTVLLTGLLFSTAPALALTNPERAYEMVSPPYKGGYGVLGIKGVAENGEGVIFESLGAFEGAPSSQVINYYLARRGASAWSSVSLEPPAALAPQSEEMAAFSPNLESVLFYSKPGPNIGAAGHETFEYEFLSHQTGTPDVTADWGVQGEVLKDLNHVKGEGSQLGFRGASTDFSHILFTSDNEHPLLAGAASYKGSLYDLVAGGEGAPALQLVGLNNHGQGELINPVCGEELGAGTLGGRESAFNAIAAGGEEIFFQTNLSSGSCSSVSQGYDGQLFVRVGGLRTLEVSRPLEPSHAFGGCERGGVPGEVPCSGATSRASAEFVGASEDGSRVFFTTMAPLTGGAGTANNLYMATIGCPAGVGEACATGGEAANTRVESLMQVSHDPNAGEAADVQGVIGVAPDGSRVYFVARGVLTGAASPDAQGYGAHGEAVSTGAVAQSGADNLYVFDAETGVTSFVADLCSGPGSSGDMSDDACPLDLTEDEGVGGTNDRSLWSVGAAEEQTAGREGGFLVFSSYGRLVANDTDNAKDVYRYDAETGALDRVSIGENGYDTNGNRDELEEYEEGGSKEKKVRDRDDATISTEGNTRVVSDDGSRIVFTSEEPLSSAAVNHLADVYEWHEEPGWSEGRVSLISTGSATEPVTHVTISPSGNDVFFVTSQGLVPQDTDGVGDVYDARLGGGFPAAPAESQPCSGDACQGPLTDPAPLLVPGSVSQSPGGNFATPAPVVAKAKPKAKPAKCKKGDVKKKDKCVKNVKSKARKAKKTGHDRRARS